MPFSGMGNGWTNWDTKKSRTKSCPFSFLLTFILPLNVYFEGLSIVGCCYWMLCQWQHRHQQLKEIRKKKYLSLILLFMTSHLETAFSYCHDCCKVHFAAFICFPFAIFMKVSNYINIWSDWVFETIKRK